MNLFRALFPQWSFFDRVVNSYQLEVRSPGESAWQTVSFDQKRSFFSLNLNGEMNLALANVSLLEHFARDLEEVSPEQIKNLSTYKMVRSLVEVKYGSKLVQYRLKQGPDELYVSEPLHE